MKKFLSVFLTAALAVGMLAGCGSKNETVTAKVIDIAQYIENNRGTND